MSFLTPLALLAGLLAIPIILLYMLRLRRREYTVSSTYLWQQILRDREANTPWQRLRRNLLLILQLLILLLLVLALARPYITVPALTSGQIAILLDASASMNATDSSFGTRFAEAQARAHEIIDTMRAGDQITLIRVGDPPEIVSSYTADTAQLHAAVDSLRPGNGAGDWTAALTLAAAGAAGAESFSVVIIGDGGIGAASGFPPIPGVIEFVPVGAQQDNLAITALASRALSGQTPQLFAEITNYSAQPVDTIFSLTVDGTLFSAERYTVPAGGRLPVVTTGLPEGYSTVQATLTRPSDSRFVDYLALDNSAVAVSPGLGSRRVLLMSSGNRFVEQALRSLPGVRTFLGDVNRGLPTDEYDLMVFDGWLPAELPQADMLIINPPDSTGLFTLGEFTENTENIRVDRADPRMTFVDFGAVNLLRFRQIEARWADALIEADGGPLLLAGETEGRQIAILPFDLRESDLPLQIAFPILIASLLDWFTPENIIAEPALRVGDTVALQPPLDVTSMQVTLPDGTVRAVSPGAAPIFADTEQPGLYTLSVTRAQGVVEQVPFAVNLFAPEESSIAPRQTITLGQVEISPEEEAELGQQEFWPWLALAALVVLMLEWLAYHRRQRAPVAFKPLAGRASR